MAASIRSPITFLKGNWLPLGVLFGLLFILVDIGIGKIYLGLDAAGHYIRVWFIHERLFSTGLLPLTNTSLEGGHAVAYPYGFLPYTVTAVLFHFFNDRAVTIMMVAGVVSLITVAGLTKFSKNLVLVAAFVAFIPFIEGLLSFQFAFFWAATFFLLYAWSIEQRRLVLGFVLMLATISTHPLLGAEAVAIYNLWLIVTQPELRKPLILMSIIAALALLPMYFYLLQAPSVDESPKGYLIVKVLWRSVRGLSLLFVPFLLIRARTLVCSHSTLVLTVLCLSTLIWIASGQTFYETSVDRAGSMYDPYFESEGFQPGAIYRVMTHETSEDGQYAFVLRGAVLSNDFFTENMFRQSWDSPSKYVEFLAKEDVDYVVIETQYIEWKKTNELDLLGQLVGAADAQMTYADPNGKFTVFSVGGVGQTDPGS